MEHQTKNRRAFVQPHPVRRSSREASCLNALNQRLTKLVEALGAVFLFMLRFADRMRPLEDCSKNHGAGLVSPPQRYLPVAQQTPSSPAPVQERTLSLVYNTSMQFRNRLCYCMTPRSRHSFHPERADRHAHIRGSRASLDRRRQLSELGDLGPRSPGAVRWHISPRCGTNSHKAGFRSTARTTNEISRQIFWIHPGALSYVFSVYGPGAAVTLVGGAAIGFGGRYLPTAYHMFSGLDPCALLPGDGTPQAAANCSFSCISRRLGDLSTSQPSHHMITLRGSVDPLQHEHITLLLIMPLRPTP